MLPEESGLRSELSHRIFRSAEDVWPAVRRELLIERSAWRPAAWSAALAVVVLTAVAVVRGRAERSSPRPPAGGFAVSNVRSLGQPAASIVLRPDSKTLMVVVD